MLYIRRKAVEQVGRAGSRAPGSAAETATDIGGPGGAGGKRMRRSSEPRGCAGPARQLSISTTDNHTGNIPGV